MFCSDNLASAARFKRMQFPNSLAVSAPTNKRLKKPSCLKSLNKKEMGELLESTESPAEGLKSLDCFTTAK